MIEYSITDGNADVTVVFADGNKIDLGTAVGEKNGVYRNASGIPTDPNVRVVAAEAAVEEISGAGLTDTAARLLVDLAADNISEADK